jgi:type III pantothenate kinase
MNTSNAIWLFDLGNSRLKGAWLDDQALSQSVSLAWETPGFDAALTMQLQQWPAPERVLIASVAAASRADRLRAALEAWPQVQPHWLRSPRHGCGITSHYRIPERLGIDRFLAMAAARAAANGGGVVVAGCGTALTLDAVDTGGAQQEGLIAPSPELMLRALRGATAIDQANPDAFAVDESDDSARALHRGCVRAAAALVQEYYARQSDLASPPLYLHGGGAAALRRSLEGEAAAHARLLEDAVLHGLALWATHEDTTTGSPSAVPPG